MQPLSKGPGSFDILCHWRLFYSTELCVSSIEKKLSSTLPNPNTPVSFIQSPEGSLTLFHYHSRPAQISKTLKQEN